MAITFSKLIDTGATQHPTATSSFTPSNNCLLIAVYMGSQDVQTAAAIASAGISGGSLAWTSRAQSCGRDNDYPGSVKIWTAPVTTGASMTASVSGTPGIGGNSIVVLQALGYDTTTPVGATGTAGGTDGTSSGAGFSYSLSGAPAASSYIISALGSEAYNDTITGSTAGTGWTLGFSAVNGSEFARACEYITGVTSTTVLWNAIVAGDRSYNPAYAAIEIKAAASATQAPPPYRKPMRFFTRRF